MEHKEHELKILPKYYRHVASGIKPFELRKDDRDFQQFDILYLREWENGVYTGRAVKREITYILRDCPEYGLKEGCCILGLGDRK